MVLFTTDDTSVEGGPGQIWLMDYDKVTDTYSINIRHTNDSINFSKQYPIEAVARYENDDIIRVYWTDNFNKVRSLNIAKESTSMGVDTAFLDLNPAIDFTRPVIKSINSGGSLPAGVYQYAFRLTSSTGAQTKASPPSRFVNIITPSEGSTEWSQLGEYTGSVPGAATTLIVTGKLVSLKAY